MPVIVKGKNVVEKSTGKLVPGGKHDSHEEAVKHAQAINIAYARKRGRDIPSKKEELGYIATILFSELVESPGSRRIVDDFGITQYFDSGNKLHRVDGPATVWNDGDEEWYIHGKLHRVGGPAVISSNHKEWWFYGKRHRTDGPAVVDKKYGEEFWVRGRQMSREEFEKHFEIKSEK